MEAPSLTRKEYHRRYYQKNKKRLDAANLQWARDNKKAKRLISRRWEAKHPSLTNFFNMMSRCYNKKTVRYPIYGGRGIRVHQPWHDFKTYEKEWGKLKPGKGYTVDRIDNDKGYFPGNVRWITRAEQKLNQRHNNRFTKGRK